MRRYIDASIELSSFRRRTALVVVEPTSRPSMQTSPGFIFPVSIVLNSTMSLKLRSGESVSNDVIFSLKRFAVPVNAVVSLLNAHSAAPMASKYGASSGTIRPGISLLRYSIIILLRAVPPVIMIFRLSIFFRSSRILFAIILQRPAVTLDFGMPLFVA